ncbi:hypothetical protein SISNIDRAFT_553054 [Sistotremastrum niveocremeum HHB9708]|uniref:Uncharacterized protein n=2 Tax=Sistotremastraceae TaxID=3402574 RepID=A0A164NI17_9AGAM|nr:hypothetical protein SISNIDRAFT_553054 [Sistotremastrum niveocremeum HHB9708]KZT35355.1 hypothetical protein SISSUDRAFT_1121661 [Sistotremastrum suecicum HHB10207 ss-3]
MQKTTLQLPTFSLSSMTREIVNWHAGQYADEIHLECRTYRSGGLIFAAVSIILKICARHKIKGSEPPCPGGAQLSLTMRASVHDSGTPELRLWPGIQDNIETHNNVQTLLPYIQQIRTVQITEYFPRDINFLLNWYSCPIIHLFFGSLHYPKLRNCGIGVPFYNHDGNIPRQFLSWLTRHKGIQDLHIVCLPDFALRLASVGHLKRALQALPRLDSLKAPGAVLGAAAKTGSKLCRLECTTPCPDILMQLRRFELGMHQLKFLSIKPGSVSFSAREIVDIFVACPHLEQLGKIGVSIVHLREEHFSQLMLSEGKNLKKLYLHALDGPYVSSALGEEFYAPKMKALRGIERPFPMLARVEITHTANVLQRNVISPLEHYLIVDFSLQKPVEESVEELPGLQALVKRGTRLPIF